jgi:hypothetical protein
MQGDDMILINTDIADPVFPLEAIGSVRFEHDDARSLRWPDGEPVMPWADPWHDILGDIAALHEAAHQSYMTGSTRVVRLECGDVQPDDHPELHAKRLCYTCRAAFRITEIIEAPR